MVCRTAGRQWTRYRTRHRQFVERNMTKRGQDKSSNKRDRAVKSEDILTLLSKHCSTLARAAHLPRRGLSCPSCVSTQQQWQWTSEEQRWTRTWVLSQRQEMLHLSWCILEKSHIRKKSCTETNLASIIKCVCRLLCRWNVVLFQASSQQVGMMGAILVKWVFRIIGKRLHWILC